jgi:phytanoyl-CoA hydroxylase
MTRLGSDNRFQIRGPAAEPIEIPVDPVPELPSDVTRPEDGRDHFDEHGYVVLRGLLDPARCEAIVRTFESAVKPWAGPLPRYPTSAVEPSRYDARGRIENGLMGAHRWPEPALAAFTKIIGELVAPGGEVARAASVFVGGPAVLIDTFYFELNGNTTPHRDIDFLPSAEKIVVMWMAFENIAPGAGRLYVYPGSHRGHVPVGPHSIVTDDYSRINLEASHRCGSPCTAPAARRGDVIAFNGAMVHGSLETCDRRSTRHSLTAHFAPAHAKIVR